METPDWFINVYSIRKKDSDFAIGRRSNLRFALGNSFAYFTSLNSKGPEPHEYLEFAKRDISQGDLHGAINALGNSKRAIHLIVDGFLKILGLEILFKRANFPDKLDIIQLLGAFPVRTIQSLNTRRNLVEHEYSEIHPNEVADFVDIAEMFLLLAYPLLSNMTVSTYVGFENDSRCFEWRLDLTNKLISEHEILNFDTLDVDNVKVPYNISTNNESKRFIKTTKIEKANREDWLELLDLLVYLSRKNVYKLPKPDEYGQGLVVR